ncbi:YbaB/EbfC family nucleoid-associated protein [Nonomuraea sp. LP-02]|uniref:YbaB/EbfC family nucleoid-associated protein n=1 Tax=Nonomuraea sp. LP-02 TaxID=3097960 RepID=UPI002E33EA19|nr:YbaB/EbfC family nucleoid-associated protein [Nonomuraea sp. LP-02]MED7925120.1 YbaB/EbfC family nucleoid-associated protein [Nonomuraea sp. LP-02]
MTKEPDDTELGRLLADHRRDLAELEALRDRLAEVRGRGEAADGRVVAETTQDGALTGLAIDPRAMRLGSDRLAEAILRASARAARAAGERAADLVTPFLAGTPLEHARPGSGPPAREERRRAR